MISFLLFIFATSHLLNSNTNEESILSYRIDYRSVVIFKNLPQNYSKIHYKPNFSEEQMPLKNHRPFGAFFPYGGIIQFDEPIMKNSIISVKIPYECRNMYISTLPNSFFRIGTPPSNVTFQKNLKFCLINFGNPSEIDIQMSTESFSKLSFLSIDGSPFQKQIYSGNFSITKHFEQNALLFFQTTYFYLNNFVNITVKQISNAKYIEPHSIFISKSSLNGSFGLLLEDPIEGSTNDETSNNYENIIKPTFHHQIKVNEKYDRNIHHNKNYRSSYTLDNNSDHFSDENGILVKLIVISVFMVCGAILLGCCGLFCIGCYSCTNITSSVNKISKSGLLLNQDTNFDDAIPPTIPHNDQQYLQQQQYYPESNNYQQTYFYIRNNSIAQQNYINQPVLLQKHQRCQYTD